MAMNMKAGETKSGVSMEQFIEDFQTLGAEETGKRYGIATRAVYKRRLKIEQHLGVKIEAPNPIAHRDDNYPHEIHKEIDTGWAVCWSDAHYWPGEPNTAHRALVKFLKEYRAKIKIVVANGDIFDGARTSRFPRIGWDVTPTIKQELDVCIERMGELEQAHPKADRTWPLGNHDARLETRLANEVPEYEGVFGMTLKDHFPHWQPCWSTWINDDVWITHKPYKGGMYAAKNSTLHAGVTTVFGHLHSQKCFPMNDAHGRRFGVDLGTLAPVRGSQFTHYLEGKNSVIDWRSGFGVLPFHKGELLTPQFVTVLDELEGRVEWMGQAYTV